MTYKPTVATLAFLAGGVSLLHAQPAALQELQNDQLIRQFQAPPPGLAPGTNAPALYPDENLDVGPQHILGLKPRHDYFNALVDSQVYYSDNANFANKPSTVSSWVFVNTVQAGFTPKPIELGSGKASVDIGLASQWYNYDNHNSTLDFNAESVFASGKYAWGKWELSADLGLNRLVNQNNYDEIYREFLPILGIQRVLPINDRMFFTLGELVDYHLTKAPVLSSPLQPPTIETHSDSNNRFDDMIGASFTWQPCSHLLLQPFYRFQYSYYQYNTEGNSYRNDLIHSFGIATAYYFNANVSVRAFYNYNRKQSDDANTPHYREMNGGLGAALDLKF